MSWRDIVKLSEKQKKLDKNHNGVIDAQDFKIINGAKDMEKLSFGNLEECPKCGAKLGNRRALERHTQEKHSSRPRGPTTRRD
jgi:hypothetical protein